MRKKGGDLGGRSGKGRSCPCRARRPDKAEESLKRLYLSGSMMYAYRIMGNVKANSPDQLNLRIGEFCLSRFPLGQGPSVTSRCEPTPVCVCSRTPGQSHGFVSPMMHVDVTTESAYIFGETMDGKQGEIKSSYLKHVFGGDELVKFYRFLENSSMSSITIEPKSQKPSEKVAENCSCQNVNIHHMNTKEVPDSDDYQALVKILHGEGRRLICTKADGNCLYRSLSVFVYGNEEKHKCMRALIVNFLGENLNFFLAYIDLGTLEPQEYVETMSVEGHWGTIGEIYVAATLLQRPIYVLTPHITTKHYQWLLVEPVFKLNQRVFSANADANICNYISLCHTNSNHFDVVWTLRNCNCLSGPPRLEGAETTDTGIETLNKVCLKQSQIKVTAAQLEPYSSSFKTTYKLEPEELLSTKKRQRVGLQCFPAPPLSNYATRAEDTAKKSFSDVLFEDIKDFRRHIYEGHCRESDLKEEIKELKQKAHISEDFIREQQRAAREQKERIFKAYTSLSCCICTDHLDSLDRKPFIMECAHVACERCKEKCDKEKVHCRVCGQACNAKSQIVFEILLNPILWMEKEILLSD